MTPEAAVGGPIALIEDGDAILIDAEYHRIDLMVGEEQIEKRRKNWQRPPSRVSGGLLAKYRADVQSASAGAITVAPPWDD